MAKAPRDTTVKLRLNPEELAALDKLVATTTPKDELPSRSRTIRQLVAREVARIEGKTDDFPQ